MKEPKRDHNCSVCGVHFKAHQAKQVRCKKCQIRKKNTRLKNYTKPCAKCGVEFNPRSNRTVMCPPCRERFVCAICGSTAKRTGMGQMYCSDRCRDLSKAEFYFGGNYVKALDRDNWRCKKCGDTNRPHVHHIDGTGRWGLAEGRNNSLDNLIVLCNACHQTLHSLTHATLMQRYINDTKEILEGFLYEAA